MFHKVIILFIGLFIWNVSIASAALKRTNQISNEALGKEARINPNDLPIDLITDRGVTIGFANVGQGNGLFLINHFDGTMFIIDAGYSAFPAGVIDATPLVTRFVALMKGQLQASANCADFASMNVIVTHPDKDHLNLLNMMGRVDFLSFQTNVRAIYLGGNLLQYRSNEAIDFLSNVKLRKENKANINIISLSHLIHQNSIVQTLGDYIDYLGHADFFDFKESLNESSLPYAMHLAIPGFLTSAQPIDSRNRFEFLCVNAYHDPHTSHICDAANTFTACIDNIRDDHKIGKPIGSLSDEAVNGNSAVVRLVLNGVSFIFTGDATGKTTRRIIREESDLRRLQARLLLASHHGAEEHHTNSADWALVVNPEIVVFSAGFHNGYDHPRFQSIYTYLMLLNLGISNEHPIMFHNVFGSQERAQHAVGNFMRNAVGQDVRDPILADLTLHAFDNHHLHNAMNGNWARVNTRKALFTTSCVPEDRAGLVFKVNEDGTIRTQPFS